jgi:hypothetical protein
LDITDIYKVHSSLYMSMMSKTQLAHELWRLLTFGVMKLILEPERNEGSSWVADAETEAIEAQTEL